MTEIFRWEDQEHYEILVPEFRAFSFLEKNRVKRKLLRSLTIQKKKVPFSYFAYPHKDRRQIKLIEKSSTGMYKANKTCDDWLKFRSQDWKFVKPCSDQLYFTKYLNFIELVFMVIFYILKL